MRHSSVEDLMDTDQVTLKVESALRQIGFLNRDSTSSHEECTNDPSGNGEQSVNEKELLDIVLQELDSLEELSNNAQMAGMSQWKQLLSQIPYHIALGILEYNEQSGFLNHREFVGYFSRDPTRKCHLIFRSLSIPLLLLPNTQESDDDDDGKSYMGFIMRRVRHLTADSAKLRILNQWMRPPMNCSIESIELTDTYSTIDQVDLQSLCPAIFTVCKSIFAAAISDNELKFKNLAYLTLHSRFSGAHIDNIKQLPAHSLTSLTLTIWNHEHIQFLSDALRHLRNLKKLHLTQVHTGDVWSDVVMVLYNAPSTLRSLTYSQHSWNRDDNMRVKITPEMLLSTLAKSIDELHLQCHVGDLTGLAEFSRLKVLSVQNLEDATEVHSLYSAFRFIPSLTELDLHISWKDRCDDSFTPFLPALTDIVNGLPGLQFLHVTIYTFCLVVSDSKMAQFLANVARSNVKLQWSMYIDVGSVSFSPDMHRSFLTVLLHPGLKHLLNNFYEDDSLYDCHEDLYQAVSNMRKAVQEIEEWQ